MAASLSEKAMLVHLRVSMWTGSRKNKKVSQQVCNEFQADADAGSWWTYYVPRKDLADLQSAANRLRAAWKNQTLPWMDEGIRIVPSVSFMEYSANMRKALQTYEDAVERFLTRYPTIVADMPRRLKQMLDSKPMPSVSDLRSKFGAKMMIFPIPDAKDFRVDLAEDEIAEIRKETESAVQEMTNRAMGSVWKKMKDVVEKMETTLSDPDKKFKDSLVGNLIQLCIDLPHLNLTENEEMEQVRKEMIDKLCQLIPDTLRTDKAARKEAAKKAEDIKKKLEQYAL